MLKGLNKDDVLQVRVSSPYQETTVRGKLFQQSDEQIRLKVSSPASLSVLTVAQVDMYGDALSAFEEYSWKRMGKVREISVIKYSQPDGQMGRATDGGCDGF